MYGSYLLMYVYVYIYVYIYIYIYIGQLQEEVHAADRMVESSHERRAKNYIIIGIIIGK